MAFEATKEFVVGLLEELALLLDLSDENTFKVRAYQRAAESVLAWEGSIGELIAAAKAGQVQGIGPQISDKIRQAVEEGELPELDQLRESFPSGVLEMFRVPGLGPKKVKALFRDLKISDLDGLKQACLDNRVASLKGFGAKTQQKILLGIEQVESYRGLHRLSDVLVQGQDFIHHLSTSGLCSEVSFCGEVRRHLELVNTLDLLVVCNHPFQLMEEMASLPMVEAVRARDEAHISLSLKSGLIANIWESKSQQAAIKLFELTGSDEHVVAVQDYAALKGYRIVDGSLMQGLRTIPVQQEEALYEILGLQYVPPELREKREFVEAAASKRLPRLVGPKELKGILHVHSTYSDGRNTLREMAIAARTLGYSYLGVSDHSRSASYAGGLTEDTVREQRREIEALNAELAPFRVFAGIESDILADGSLDYDEQTLAQFDFIIASVHSQFQMSKAEMTTRIVRAICNPYTTAIGHLTGRLLLDREGYELDLEEILLAAADRGVAIECNGNPHRLDLNWEGLLRAKRKGVKTSLGPDAHAAEDLTDIDFSLGVARKAGLEAGDIINCKTADAFGRWCLERRKGGVKS